MCLEIYLGSDKKIPEIKWDIDNPGFTCLAIEDKDIPDYIQSILDSKYYYDLGSHMGCTCGFHYAKGRLEDHDKRFKDVLDCFAYLNAHKTNNTIKLFGIMWDEFKDEYETKEFYPQIFNEHEFYFPELKILTII